MAIPNQEHRFLDAAGRVDVVWLRFLRGLGEVTDIAALQTAVTALRDELAAIGTPRDVIGQYSVQAIPGDGAYYLHLLGDTEEPGFTYCYGTGPDGLKGWYPVADAFLAGTNVTLDTDPDTGVTTINATGGGSTTQVLVVAAGDFTLNAATHRDKLLLYGGGVVTLPETVASGFVVNDIVEVRWQSGSGVDFAPETGSVVLDFNDTVFSASINLVKDIVGLKVIAPDTWALFGALADA